MSYFSDVKEEEEEVAPQANQGKEGVKEANGKWEQVDASEYADMPKEKASAAPHTPGKTPPKKPESAGVASIEKGMGTMSVAAPPAPKFASFNFDHRYMMTAPVTTYLKDGERQVYINYLVHTAVSDSFRVTVLEDGLSVRLQAKIPKAFIDLVPRAFAEFDLNSENSCVIESGFRSTVDMIARTVGPDFDNIWSTGQVDPLPFPCQGNPHCQIMWHEGDDAIKNKLYNNPSTNPYAKHQMMPLLRVVLESKEKMRKSTVHVKGVVLCHRLAFKSCDCAPPPPPPAPFLSPGYQRRRGNYGGGIVGGAGFPALMGGYGHKLHMTSSYSSMNGSFDAADNEQIIKVNTSPIKNGNNNSPRKRKSPTGYEDDGDAKMAVLDGALNLVEDFYSKMEKNEAK